MCRRCTLTGVGPASRAGYNVCIFAYGQTGSGKTHTMAGTDVENLAGRGINYRALDDLFAINAQRAGEVQTDMHPVTRSQAMAMAHGHETCMNTALGCLRTKS